MAINKSTVPVDVTDIISTKDFTGSIGVITSGASVEYMVIEPKQVAIVQAKGTGTKLTSISKPQESISRQIANEKLSKVPHMAQSEKTRGQEWHKKMNTALNPEFGKFKTLEALNKNAALNSEFVYTTKETFSSDKVDYVVFATGTGSSAQVGVSPNTNPESTALLSLVSGNFYNKSGTVIGHMDNSIKIYEQQNKTLSSSVLAKIKTSKTAYWKIMSGPFKFENITLTGDTNAMNQGVFVYAGSPLNPAVRGKTDYYVMASTNALGINRTGQLLILGRNTPPIDSIVSLITGDIFNFSIKGKTPSVISSKNISGITAKINKQSTYNVYKTYETQLDPTTKAAIIAAQKAFKAEQKATTDDQKLITETKSALHAINSAVTAATNQLVWTPTTKLTAANNEATKATTELKAALTVFQKAENSQTQLALQKSLASAKKITKTTTAAVTVALATPSLSGSGSGTNDGSSLSNYGYSSSSQNYNTSSLGSYSSSYGYGTDSFPGASNDTSEGDSSSNYGSSGSYGGDGSSSSYSSSS